MKASPYSLNYLCFACRKAYRQPSLRVAGGHYVRSGIKKGSLEAAHEIEATRHRCPQCQAVMVCAGRNIVIPPASMSKEWAALEQELVSRATGYTERRDRALDSSRASRARGR